MPKAKTVEKYGVPMINIAGNPHTITAAAQAIKSILDADRSDQVTLAAIDAMSRINNAPSNITITNCSLSQDYGRIGDSPKTPGDSK
jgi:hypothetical protein